MPSDRLYRVHSLMELCFPANVDPERRHKLTRKRRQFANISVLRFRMVALSVFMQQQTFLLVRIWDPQAAAMLVQSPFTAEAGAENGRLVTWCTLTSHMTALFMTPPKTH